MITIDEQIIVCLKNMTMVVFEDKDEYFKWVCGQKIENLLYMHGGAKTLIEHLQEGDALNPELHAEPPTDGVSHDG